MRRHSHNRPRRGIILLIVLAVLAMFGLLALTFVLVAAHYQRSAILAARAEQNPASPEGLLDSAFHQVVRGTQNTASVLRIHSLLEDMYGNQSISGEIDGSATSIAGGQILEYASTVSTPLDVVGRVITFTSGNAQGYSTRIVGCNLTVTPNRLQVLVPNWPASPAGGDTFVINGRDFGGAGVGYNESNGKLDKTLSTSYGSIPYAYIPNPALFPTGTDPAGPGGANEDYDAPDNQNLFLAMTATNGTVIIPSFHRSALIRYSESHYATATMRNALLRPHPTDHPNFTGSNPSFSATWDGVSAGGLWDVDNDGDGIPDSIWVDLGFPARATKDGRLYKPLVAILCTDLDGRLNLNAHGSATQVAANYYGAISAPNRAGGALHPVFASGAGTAQLPRGQGFGPADINLGPLFGNGDIANNAVLQTSYGSVVVQRYGADGVPGAAGDDPLSQNLTSQYWNTCWKSSPQFLDLSSYPSSWEYDYWKYFTDVAHYLPCGYGSPFDMKAKGAVGLDVRGQPVYPQMCDASDHVNDPYEMDLFGKRGVDLPYTVAELEGLLRRFDKDGNELPPTLRSLLARSLPPFTEHATDVSKEVTTQSCDVPVAGLGLSADLRASMSASWGSLAANTRNELKTQLRSTLDPMRADATLVDLLIVRVAHGLEQAGIASNAIPADVAALLPRLLPIELGMGLKMDLNRPFGNGLDDNNNGVVDEPALAVRNSVSSPLLVLSTSYQGELILASPKLKEKMPQLTAAGASVVDAALQHSKGVDVDGDGSVTDADNALARQLMARQLYVMTLLLTDYKVANPASPTQAEKDRARLIAQWAINVVDFRDRDSIMTPFEYDVSPFTDEDADGSTWDVDGVISTASNPSADDDESSHRFRGLVWGCERPELLLTETLAVHDRATEDLKIAGIDNPKTGKPDDYRYNPDDTDRTDVGLNQKKRPRGALFVEIFNPWTEEEPESGELHHGTLGGVDLTKKAPGSNSPVWRLAIFNDPSKTIDPENPPIPERSVYLADISGGIDIPAAKDGLEHYPSNPPTGTTLQPGQYCVIGPGDNDMINSGGNDFRTRTFLGLKAGTSLPDGTTRSIILPPFTGGGAFDVTYNRSAGLDLQPLKTASQIDAPMAVAVDKARLTTGNQASTDNLRLSISETFGGYPLTDYSGGNFDKTSQVYPTAFPYPLDRYPNPGDTTNENPLWPTLVRNGTFTGFRVIHLQRLANPLLAWDEHANPYRTIDVMMVDLTTFNGTPETAGHTGEDPVPPGAPSPNMTDKLYSRERGENNDTTNDNDLWMQEPLGSPTPPVPKPNGALDPVANHVFNHPLHHTLGYLNWDLNKGHESEGPRDATLNASCVGSPRGKPFPWLRWANRPFVSPYELLEVPAMGAGWLLRNPADIDQNKYPYGNRLSLISATTPDPYFEETDHFTHLWNFAFSGTSGSFSATFGAGKLPRLLDLVEVPSPFVDAELQGNPSKFASTTGHTFHPPFNRVPTWRKPGLVNLNTISSPVVWQGLLNYYPAMNTTSATPTAWDELLVSRRRGLMSNTVVYPTDFANPFRAAVNAELVPTLVGGAWPGAQYEVFSTLLRPDPETGKTGMMLENDVTSSEVTNARRNPHFRYELLERLSNLTTTRSNVYAIWITVGYFEVGSSSGNQLGAELGTDTGEVKRHRAFYIFDRSIPVGFQRGENLNVDKAVLLKRFIE